MNRGRGTTLPVGVAVAALLIAGTSAVARESEEQLVQRIQIEQNPVRKAKAEIKLSNFQLARVRDSYSQGRVDDGVKQLAAFMATVNSSWKLLHDSGRTPAKHAEGFRELEIVLREDVRALQDVQRVVGYFDRAPLERAGKDLEQMQGQLIHELFPGGQRRNSNESNPPTPTPGPASSPEKR